MTTKNPQLSEKKKRKTIRINENCYKMLLEIQRIYIRKFGFSPTITQTVEIIIAEFSKTSDEKLGQLADDDVHSQQNPTQRNGSIGNGLGTSSADANDDEVKNE